MGQSCAHARIEWWEKNTVSDAARTASLTDLRRWPGDGFFGQNTEVGIPTLVWRRLGRLEASAGQVAGLANSKLVLHPPETLETLETLETCLKSLDTPETAETLETLETCLQPGPTYGNRLRQDCLASQQPSTKPRSGSTPSTGSTPSAGHSPLRLQRTTSRGSRTAPAGFARCPQRPASPAPRLSL